jgi:hypothetical protein
MLPPVDGGARSGQRDWGLQQEPRQRVGMDGQVNRAGQDRVYRPSAGERHQVQAAGICGDRQVRHGNLIRDADIAVLADRDEQPGHLWGAADVLRPCKQRSGGDLGKQRVPVDPGHRRIRAAHPLPVGRIQQVQEPASYGPRGAGHPQDVQRETPRVQIADAPREDPHR